MALVQTKILRERWEVQPRLIELKLNRLKLLRVAALAVHEARNTTPFHAANAPGTFAYHTGVWALRDAFVGQDGWAVDRTSGIEGIYNIDLRLRVVYANVDISCDDDHGPKPRSEKGPGSERVCSGNLFGSLPTYTKAQDEIELTYYAMVDDQGVLELTRPLVQDGTFKGYYERLYIRPDEDEPPGGRRSLDDDDAINDFDPQVARKK